YEYRLRNNDKINISVWDHDDLSVGSIYGIYNSGEVYGKWLMVDAAGNVTLPKVGAFKVKDLTITEAKASLKEIYKKWIVEPVVEIKVLNKEVTLIGEFKSPGKYILEKEKNTLLELIGAAGDFDFYANKKKIQIIREVDGAAKNFTVNLSTSDGIAKANITILPGDVVYAPSRSGKNWDRRAASTIVPIASAISTAVLVWGILK
ncbi:MAG: polysaccharide export protein, partial [Pedobacter sp.]